MHQSHFGYTVGNQDKSWEPHICYTYFANNLNSGKRRRSNNHVTDCCFCVIPPLIEGITKKNVFPYPSLPSALYPVCYSD